MTLRRIIVAAIIMVFLLFSWYGAEMMIHGESQRSAVDITVMILISVGYSGKLEKEMKKDERARKLARDIANQLKKRAEKDGKDGSKK